MSPVLLSVSTNFVVILVYLILLTHGMFVMLRTRPFPANTLITPATTAALIHLPTYSYQVVGSAHLCSLRCNL